MTTLGTMFNPLALDEIRREQRYVSNVLRGSRSLPPIALHYRKRQQSTQLDVVSEIPEDATVKSETHTAPDCRRKQLSSSNYDANEDEQHQVSSKWRLSVPDVLGSQRSLDGIINPHDIRRFSYDSLLNPAIDELRRRQQDDDDPTITGGQRRRLSSLGIAVDDAAQLLHLRRDDDVDDRLNSVVDRARRSRLRSLPTFAFSPGHRNAADTAFDRGLRPRATSFDDVLWPIEFRSARGGGDQEANRSGYDAERDRNDFWMEIAAIDIDGRLSTTSSLSDVSTLQRLYGPRTSAVAVSRRMSGTSIGSAPRSALSCASRQSGRCTRTANSGGEQREVGSMLDQPSVRQYGQSLGSDASNNNNRLAADIAGRRAPKGSCTSPAIFLPKINKKKPARSQYTGDISRAFVYSYFNLLPSDLCQSSDEDPEQDRRNANVKGGMRRKGRRT